MINQRVVAVVGWVSMAEGHVSGAAAKERQVTSASGHERMSGCWPQAKLLDERVCVWLPRLLSFLRLRVSANGVFKVAGGCPDHCLSLLDRARRYRPLNLLTRLREAPRGYGACPQETRSLISSSTG